MSSVDVLLTVGKLDASLALLTTQDHHVIEFPTVLLPENVKAGSIIKMQVSQNLEEEKKQRNHFKSIQAKILEKYGTHKPESPVLKIVNVTQTSCVLAWDPLKLGSAKLKSLILYRKGIRSMVIPNPFKVTTTKISGLSVDTPYEFQLKLITTSGTLWSEKVILRTHKMTDMSGITVCLGPLDPLKEISDLQISQCLSHIGARPLQRHVAIDTTHFVCNDLDNEESNEELIRAKHNNIPIVRPEWVRACEVEKRIVGVRGFYLDADQSILKSYTFPPVNEEELSYSKENEPVAEVADENKMPEDTTDVEQVASHNDNEGNPSEAKEQGEKSGHEAAPVSPAEDPLHASTALENETTIETVNPSVRSLKSEPVGTPNIEENKADSSAEAVVEEPNEAVAESSPNEGATGQKSEDTDTHSNEQADNGFVQTEEVAENNIITESARENNEPADDAAMEFGRPEAEVETPEVNESIEDANEPVEDANEPVEDANEPVEDTSEPVEDTSEPAKNAGEPVQETNEFTTDIASPRHQEEDIELEAEPKDATESVAVEPSNEDVKPEEKGSEAEDDINNVSKEAASGESTTHQKTEASASLESSAVTEEQETTEAEVNTDDVLSTKEAKKNSGNSNSNKKKNKKNKKKGKKK
ncbi:Chs5p [Saccharomyces cerevisiae YJM1478]|uniref:Chitin biosynthesis protein CHS5 n=2 Tax=Saccharomyces TaxID=4930 RepID=H0GKM5_SACCK|nr:Chs5p [Saccharomyces cerevisiae YJM1078]AJV46823.1 Chs5p [Saccharomyces cerevisiae YJM1129]AJV49541.1 Chs5p [Saccharomyces cerevisiae YJM1242]AJV49995.1 Chs5p [Saccharomyces cerevisiae YJM1244]AJV51306.1 Chs5p [Saccharomyces cerevisiae YJM1252]AJV53103.1 Chs5p [Saccharomyces cerevisiae YJM1311]AJV53996.1 Chs5p [Saccharomyces cerevisiae YJM1332]AJV54451.1 Chs5p [Saccharomyces cerevisiae YJM1336]AJV55340.1 Chs5p [Saccharomyces cerevisiae YJM1341]AJV56237.1 Chs5p [Saccharomyces cerevisiae 